MKKIVSILLLIAIVAALGVVFVGCESTKTEENVYTSQDGKWQYRVEHTTISGVSEDKATEFVAQGYTAVDATTVERTQYVLTAYLGNAADLVVPATVDGYTVDALADGLFVCIDDGSTKRRNRDTYTANTVLKTIAFEAADLDISARCFYMCSALESITLPASCKAIGDFAFYGCTALTSISMPQSMASIGAYAFRECPNLTTVYIHNAADATLPPKLGNMCFYMVNQKMSDDDQYYIVDGFRIVVDNISVFNETVIKEERKASHSNDYKYWLDYMPDEKHPDRNYIYAA